MQKLKLLFIFLLCLTATTAQAKLFRSAAKPVLPKSRLNTIVPRQMPLQKIRVVLKALAKRTPIIAGSAVLATIAWFIFQLYHHGKIKKGDPFSPSRRGAINSGHSPSPSPRDTVRSGYPRGGNSSAGMPFSPSPLFGSYPPSPGAPSKWASTARDLNPELKQAQKQDTRNRRSTSAGLTLSRIDDQPRQRSKSVSFTTDQPIVIEAETGSTTNSDDEAVDQGPQHLPPPKKAADADVPSILLPAGYERQALVIANPETVVALPSPAPSEQKSDEDADDESSAEPESALVHALPAGQEESLFGSPAGSIPDASGIKFYTPETQPDRGSPAFQDIQPSPGKKVLPQSSNNPEVVLLSPSPGQQPAAVLTTPPPGQQIKVGPNNPLEPVILDSCRSEADVTLLSPSIEPAPPHQRSATPSPDPRPGVELFSPPPAQKQAKAGPALPPSFNNRSSASSSQPVNQSQSSTSSSVSISQAEPLPIFDLTSQAGIDQLKAVIREKMNNAPGFSIMFSAYAYFDAHSKQQQTRPKHQHCFRLTKEEDQLQYHDPEKKDWFIVPECQTPADTAAADRKRADTLPGPFYPVAAWPGGTAAPWQQAPRPQ